MLYHKNLLGIGHPTNQTKRHRQQLLCKTAYRSTQSFLVVDIAHITRTAKPTVKVDAQDIISPLDKTARAPIINKPNIIPTVSLTRLKPIIEHITAIMDMKSSAPNIPIVP